MMRTKHLLKWASQRNSCCLFVLNLMRHHWRYNWSIIVTKLSQDCVWMANNEGGRVSIKLPTKPGSEPRRDIKEREKQIQLVLCNATKYPLFSDWFMHDLRSYWMEIAATASADSGVFSNIYWITVCFCPCIVSPLNISLVRARLIIIVGGRGQQRWGKIQLEKLRQPLPPPFLNHGTGPWLGNVSEF